MTDGIETKQNADGSWTGKATGIRVFDMMVNVSGYLEGKFDDWPPNIQDPIYVALEKKTHEVELPLTIIDSGCGQDEDGFYLHVIASEVVVGDERFVRDSKKEAMEIAAQSIRKKLN